MLSYHIWRKTAKVHCIYGIQCGQTENGIESCFKVVGLGCFRIFGSFLSMTQIPKVLLDAETCQTKRNKDLSNYSSTNIVLILQAGRLFHVYVLPVLAVSPVVGLLVPVPDVHPLRRREIVFDALLLCLICSYTEIRVQLYK